MQELSKLLFENIVEAVFPHKCSCGKWGTTLCYECSDLLVTTKTELCPLCKQISQMGRVCTSCRYRTLLTGVMIVGPHEKVLKDSIWRLKYGPLKDISKPLADIIVQKYGNFLKEKRFTVTFTPTSAQRMAQRGYNQSEEIAKIVAKETGLLLEETMSRPHDVVHQVGLTRVERLQNVVGTISYIGKEFLEKKKVVIIDDVYTTGATLEECAKVLRKAGYREVWGLVLSRD